MILNDPGGWCNWFPIIIIEGQRLAVDENVDGNGTLYSRMYQVNFLDTAFNKFEVILFFKQTVSLQIFLGCLAQILLGPFLNILTQISDWF